MREWKDENGKVWTVDVGQPDIKAVRKEVGFDLAGLGDRDALEGLIRDPVLMVDVLHVLCKTQADAAGIDERDFARLLRGDVIDDATQALLGAVVDFFPSGPRTVMREAIEKFDLTRKLMEEEALKRLRDPELEASLRREVKEAFAPSVAPQPSVSGETSTDSEASSE